MLKEEKNLVYLNVFSSTELAETPFNRGINEERHLQRKRYKEKVNHALLNAGG